MRTNDAILLIIRTLLIFSIDSTILIHGSIPIKIIAIVIGVMAVLETIYITYLLSEE